jgi:general secretion pathway protein M
MNEVLRQAWVPRREKAQAAWRRLAPRERTMVAVGAVALGLLLFVLVFINPALRTLREAPLRLAELDAKLAQMQGWAAEAAQLQQQPTVSSAQALAALQAATEFLGPEAQLQIQGDRASLRFRQLSGEQLGSWLMETRRAARARAVEAQLQRGADGLYSGSVVLQLASGS